MNDTLDPFWQRMSAAADRAEKMAKNARHERETMRPLGSVNGRVPYYTDEDGPEIVLGEGTGVWLGWPRRRWQR